MARWVLLVGILVFVAPPKAVALAQNKSLAPGDAEKSGRERLGDALALVRAGHEREAALALVRLAGELPKDPAAAEALFQAAQLYEQNLEDPERAMQLYDELSQREPQSHLGRRARLRKDELALALRSGAAPLIELIDIIKTYRSAGFTSTAARLRALLREHPDFARADQALYLLGQAYREAGQTSEAEAALIEVSRRYPSSPYRPRAEQLLGDILRMRRQYGRARAYFAELRRYPDPYWQAAATAGEDACNRDQRRRLLFIASLLYLGCFGAVLAVRAGKGLWPPPFELLYYGPVAGFLFLVARARTAGNITTTVLLVGLGGLGLTWLSGSSARVASTHGGHSLTAPAAAAGRGGALGLILGLLARVLAVAALLYAVFYSRDLLSVILYTLHEGAEGRARG